MATNATTLIREALTVGTVVDLAAWKLRAAAFLTPKAKAAAGPVDTADMTDAQLFAHFKRIAPVEDVRFWLQSEMSNDLRLQFMELLDETVAGTVGAPEHKRRFTALKDAWRVERRSEAWPSAETWGRLARFQASRQARLAEVARLDRKVEAWTEEAARIDAELAAEAARPVQQELAA